MERRAETQGAFERGEEPSEGSARPAEARAWKRDVLEVIEARSSTRKFAQDPVTDEQRYSESAHFCKMAGYEIG